MTSAGRPAGWLPARSAPALRQPMIILKDDHGKCGLCAGTDSFTDDSARWPVPLDMEAL